MFIISSKHYFLAYVKDTFIFLIRCVCFKKQLAFLNLLVKQWLLEGRDGDWAWPRWLSHSLPFLRTYWLPLVFYPNCNYFVDMFAFLLLLAALCLFISSNSLTTKLCQKNKSLLRSVTSTYLLFSWYQFWLMTLPYLTIDSAKIWDKPAFTA